MLPNTSSLEGKRVPNVTFKTRNNHQWKDVTTNDLFKGKTVVVFSLPGAYTPTCSSTHLPRYNELAGVFKTNGVDDIVCLSVNDAFVMNEWKNDQDAENINVIPDGNGEFTAGMGLLVDKGYHYDEISLGKHNTSSTLRGVSGSGTWPQIFIGGKLIGGTDELETYFGNRKAA